MTEQEISQALQTLLHEYSKSSSNTNTTTASTPFTSVNAVVQHLESRLGLDLSHKADFIQAQIQQFLFQPQQPLQNDHLAPQQNLNFHPTPSPSPSPSSTVTVSSSAFHSLPYHPDPVAPLKHESAAVSTNQTPKQSGPSKAKRRGGPGGLNKLCGVSPQLEAIVGHPALPRTEIVKQLWAYIRKNNLQDPNNKRRIICNDELRLVFETDCTDMFKMNKLLAKHIIPLEPTKQLGSKKQKVLDHEESGTRPTVSTCTTPCVAISEALANFFGVGEREMLQSEVFTRLWQYINVNNLEDPLNPMVILCDKKLQELFGCQSLPASRIPEVLASHHIFRT